jgi:hypothetical protein
VLGLLARHSHARADRYRTGGFRFHAHLNAWEWRSPGCSARSGGRKPKRARLLAEGQAADARPDPAIAALLRDPQSLTATLSPPRARSRFSS